MALVEISARERTGHAALSKVHVAENNVIFAGKLLDDGVPGRRLLASSSSSFGGDKTHKHGFATVDGFRDLALCAVDDEPFTDLQAHRSAHAQTPKHV
jgi:hypothetical protein